MIFVAVFGGLYGYGPEPYRRGFFSGFGIVLFLLLFLLGWKLFGFVVT